MVMKGTDMKIAQTPDDLETFDMDDAYARWLEQEGVPVIVDFAFEDLAKIKLGPWERKGGSGAIINIPNDHLTNDSRFVMGTTLLRREVVADESLDVAKARPDREDAVDARLLELLHVAVWDRAADDD